jgi:alkanesulfonate monooxygenase SsuD/methylene tetrahydromethanopterin reductase-like flavin-dependent oxidoreductase (luciferase family)
MPAAAPTPPVWVGVGGPKGLAVTGRNADGWIPPHAADGLTRVSKLGVVEAEERPCVPAHQGLTSPQDPDHTSATAAVERAELSLIAVEADRLVPPSGNLWIGGQQIWLGPALAGRAVTIWVDETSLHVLLDGTRELVVDLWPIDEKT